MSSPDVRVPSGAPKKDHGRAGRNLPAAVASAVVLLAAIAASLAVWKTAFMVIVAIAVVVAVWELQRGLSTADIDIPEQPLMVGGVVMSWSRTSGARRPWSRPPPSRRWR